MIAALAATDEPFANLLRDPRSRWEVVHDYGMGTLLVAAEDEGAKPTPRVRVTAPSTALRVAAGRPGRGARCPARGARSGRRRLSRRGRGGFVPRSSRTRSSGAAGQCARRRTAAWRCRSSSPLQDESGDFLLALAEVVGGHEQRGDAGGVCGFDDHGDAARCGGQQRCPVQDDPAARACLAMAEKRRSTT